MTIFKPELAPEERKQAYALWQALMFAPTAARLEEARQKLRETPDPVRGAVIHTIAEAWRQARETSPDENPFAEAVGHVVLSCRFNGQQFEQRALFDPATGRTRFCFTINGAEIPRDEWVQKQEDAIAQDLARFVDKTTEAPD